MSNVCLDHDDGAGAQASGAPVAVGAGLREVARAVAALAETRSPHIVGYGNTKPGDRVLIAIDTQYEQRVAVAFAEALRDRGAKVDILRIDAGPDREFEDLDEVRVTIRDVPFTQAPRRWEGLPWVEELARAEGYDLLIHGKGGPTPQTTFRYEQIPWLRAEHLEQGAATFPLDLHHLINVRTWERIWSKGRGAKVRLTDPEGTDLTFTLHEKYFDGSRRGFNADPLRSHGHLHGHPPQPILDEEDTAGVIAGTTSHFARPFPQIRLHFSGGRLEAVEGGGRYGDAWRDLLSATKTNQYPCFPRPGLFWLWELAIGTNPRIKRPSDIHLLSSGGFEWERRRSGLIHAGIGTRWRGPEEVWAGERGITYGHLHVHLLFPTYAITTTTPQGETIKVIDNGRLAALDDPDVRDLARRYGDPDVILKEDWIPLIPGITAAGSYADYAKDPVRYLYPAR